MKLKIGFFADGPWSHKAFKKIIQDNNLLIKFICVRFDTKDKTLKNYSEEYNIDYLKHENINSKDFIDNVKKYNCDLFVSMSFNQIFKKEIINLPKFKIINCHAGKLPFYRGRNVLNWVLINDEKEFGITVHFIDQGIDTGDIILQETYQITDKDNYSSLLKLAHVECAKILYKAINLINSSQKVSKIKQDTIHPIGFYCPQRTFGDEVLDWKNTSREIFNFIRAISKPGPMALSYIQGKEIKINNSKIYTNAPNYKSTEGYVVGIDKKGVCVKTSDNFLLITEYEYDGKLKVGDKLERK